VPAGTITDSPAGEKELDMSNVNFFDLARNRFRTGLAELDKKWGWYFALGVLLVVLGSIASATAVGTTMLSVVMLGWILLVGGAGLIALSFVASKWSGFLLTLAAGALHVIAGFTLLSFPRSGAVAITLMVGAIWIGAGIYRAIASMVMRFPNWGWHLVSGIVSFVVGAMLVRGLATTSLWFLGLYLGVDLIIHGLSWITFALRVHGLARELAISEERRPAA